MSTCGSSRVEAHLNLIFDSIWNEEHGCSKNLTRQQLHLIDYAFQTGTPLGYLIKGLVPLRKESLGYALMAEAMGCTHPRLNAAIGRMYYDGYEVKGKIVGVAYDKAQLYLEKSVRDGWPVAHIALAAMLPPADRHFMLTKPEYSTFVRKCIRYLEDALNQGYTERELALKIADYYKEAFPKETRKQLEAYQWCLDMGLSLAAERIVDLSDQHGSDDYDTTFESTVLPLKAHANSPDLKAEAYVVLLNILLRPSYTPPRSLLGLYKDKFYLALSLCDELIAIGSPRGYFYKGRIYHEQFSNLSKALDVWLEADARGVANYLTYTCLGCNPLASPKNGWRRLLYCRKGFELSPYQHKKLFLIGMSNVYREGMPPIPRDLEKLRELEEMVRVYENGSQDAG